VPPPVFPASGPLCATPPFPRSGPGEPGSPTSAVLRRRYDFPCASTRSLMDSVPGSTCSSVFVFAMALPQRRRSALGPGDFGQPVSPSPAACTGARTGSLRFPGAPSHTFARISDPGRTSRTSPLSVLPMLPPGPIRRRLQQSVISGLNPGLWCPLPTLHERRCHHPCKARFRLAGCGLCREGVEPSGAR
jgi:hypothetical protein